ncbi:MAG TPA: TrkA family potassium uptake protein [Myxococcaceae bacterium]|nr:TrkA family potassium uptake protein [Myxococcaceae bacterium]
MVRKRRRVMANLRYLFALVSRFKITVGMGVLLFGVAPLVFVSRYRTPEGDRLEWGEALRHVYFLHFGQPSLPYSGDWVVEVLNVVIPPFGIAVVVDGIVRFTYLYFAKHRSDKEWIQVTTSTLQDHVIVCGAGRVGYRVAHLLLDLGRELVVIEKREDAAFVSVLRDLGALVLIDDIKSPHTLARTNVAKAAAIVCATDDDLANLNVCLDARKLNPNIRVVIRLFDDDLVAKVRDTFKAEALSSSALAAPAMALTALDPRIMHSFQVSGHLMVVSRFVARLGLPDLSLSDLRDRFGGLTLSLSRAGGGEVLNPQGNTRIQAGDVLVVQCQYREYLKLRQFTAEEAPPMSLNL